MVFSNYTDMLTELSRREKEANIKPDPDVDVYMKVKIHLIQTKSCVYIGSDKGYSKLFVLLCKQAISVEGQESVVTDYILKVSKNIPQKKKIREMDMPPNSNCISFADSGSGDLCGYNGWRLYDQRYLRRTKEARHNRYVQSAVKLRFVHQTL